MIQFLSAIIEWLALAALSSVGIEFEPSDCAAAGPAEYRTLSASYVAGPTEAVLTTRFDEARFSGSDCAEAATGLFRIDDTPQLITEMPRSYDS